MAYYDPLIGIICQPRNFVRTISSIFFLYNQYVIDNIMNSWLWISENHLIIQDRNEFDNDQKFSKFLLEIMRPVSPANNISSDREIM